MNRQLSKGMTLIELMVVVVIIGILAGIAYPSYRQTVIRANRTEAKTILMQVAQGLEKCYTRHNAYNSPNCNLQKGKMDADFSTTNYAIAAPILTPTTYVLQATPRAGQAGDATCGVLAINELGERRERTDQVIVPANRCW
jgi:type IV pilus assembly protein PilE